MLVQSESVNNPRRAALVKLINWPTKPSLLNLIVEGSLSHGRKTQHITDKQAGTQEDDSYQTNHDHVSSFGFNTNDMLHGAADSGCRERGFCRQDREAGYSKDIYAVIFEPMFILRSDSRFSNLTANAYPFSPVLCATLVLLYLKLSVLCIEHFLLHYFNLIRDKFQVPQAFH
ncbi:hypothetical protein PV325_004729 [Microctonus aethiopoides]|nr:hypothetical protein PV325_004729 [Microctonus aethiopoides]